MFEDINEILEIASWAPSGDNSQPWAFEITDKAIVNVFNLPKQDNPVLNYKQSGSYIAHGALLENIVIASCDKGYRAKYKLFPNPTNLEHVLEIEFLKESSHESSLFPYIKLRHTNRKAYKNTFLSTQVLENLTLCEESGIKVGIVDDPNIRKVISKSASIMEKIALENKKLHSLFFKDILWKGSSNDEGVAGLYIKSLELPLPVQQLFRVIKNWHVCSLLNGFGFSTMAAHVNAKIYSSGAGMVMISLEDDSSESFIKAGMITQRVWLILTKFGLSVQPVTGLLFLGRKVHGGETGEFNGKHLGLIRLAYSTIVSVFKLENRVPAMMLRVGESGPATARSGRHKPKINLVKTGVKNTII